MSLNIFELNEVTKSYERKIVLSSLSFFIKRGESIALIGPSGSGKTTLLNSLACINKIDSGSILIDGKSSTSYKNPKKLAKKVGIIRQQFDLVRELPVVHNVLAGRFSDWGFLKSLISLIIPRDLDMAKVALERVGLLDKLYERTADLSGGQQQRVAIARLIVQNPEVILADEPVASLDPTRSEDILSILTSISKENNKTLIASLHSVEYAKKYFDRIIALRDGKIYFDLESSNVSEDDLAELYKIDDTKEPSTNE
ncbi:phosphonate ABC transporter ATP-binding protein [Clostridium cylindrosporum]|uniref:Phosphonates import ATP-binding protein PhnC n=1 Tax=Clostridium cylindrosporum DSM 605 TaxID=1121307 RepID=A0A0J8G5A3_CLOCY|nr:ATP-binding cassette domain-containing protein [Clostridium cylindrosporum]KMT22841.1 phosphonates import ATP-binding protein PhnC [Clostridium cylindrosporum DSM 605]